jgi:hypothetical protein
VKLMDPDVLTEAALQLRERYADDDEFAAAMERLEALLAADGGEDAETGQTES